MPTSLEDFIDVCPWESEAQRKGFLALVMSLRRNKAVPEDWTEVHPSLFAVASWFAQKDHESNEWYNERIGDLSTRIEDELVSIIDENRVLRGEIEELKAAVAKLVSHGP